jgi:hypothetical protein
MFSMDLLLRLSHAAQIHANQSDGITGPDTSPPLVFMQRIRGVACESNQVEFTHRRAANGRLCFHIYGCTYGIADLLKFAPWGKNEQTQRRVDRTFRYRTILGHAELPAGAAARQTGPTRRCCQHYYFFIDISKTKMARSRAAPDHWVTLWQSLEA